MTRLIMFKEGRKHTYNERGKKKFGKRKGGKGAGPGFI